MRISHPRIGLGVEPTWGGRLVPTELDGASLNVEGDIDEQRDRCLYHVCVDDSGRVNLDILVSLA